VEKTALLSRDAMPHFVSVGASASIKHQSNYTDCQLPALPQDRQAASHLTPFNTPAPAHEQAARYPVISFLFKYLAPRHQG